MKLCILTPGEFTMRITHPQTRPCIARISMKATPRASIPLHRRSVKLVPFCIRVWESSSRARGRDFNYLKRPAKINRKQSILCIAREREREREISSNTLILVVKPRRRILTILIHVSFTTREIFLSASRPIPITCCDPNAYVTTRLFTSICIREVLYIIVEFRVSQHLTRINRACTWIKFICSYLEWEFMFRFENRTFHALHLTQLFPFSLRARSSQNMYKHMFLEYEHTLYEYSILWINTNIFITYSEIQAYPLPIKVFLANL